MKRNENSRRGFTLIELVAVIVVLAILAGVALPKYFDYAADARESACKGALGGVRAACANFYANQAIAGTPRYPRTAELTALGTVLQENFPNNPYTSLSTVKQTLVLADSTGRATDATTGWYYYIDDATTPTIYDIWPNSDTDDGTVDEHDF